MSAGLGVGAIVGISIGVVAGVLLLAGYIYIRYFQKKKKEEVQLLSLYPNGRSSQPRRGKVHSS